MRTALGAALSFLLIVCSVTHIICSGKHSTCYAIRSRSPVKREPLSANRQIVCSNADSSALDASGTNTAHLDEIIAFDKGIGEAPR